MPALAVFIVEFIKHGYFLLGQRHMFLYENFCLLRFLSLLSDEIVHSKTSSPVETHLFFFLIDFIELYIFFCPSPFSPLPSYPIP